MKLALKILKNHFSGVRKWRCDWRIEICGNLLEMEGWNLSITFIHYCWPEF
jgi:hypothetical protein